MTARALVLFAAIIPAARAQFQLFAVVNNTPQPVSATYDFGTAPAGSPAKTQFQIKNTASTAKILTVLRVAGAGFTLPSPPSLPRALGPQETLSFTVQFQAADIGSYSASLGADGISVLLTAAALPSLTYELQTTSGNQALNGAVDFGSVEIGQTQSLQFLIENRAAQVLVVPAIVVSGTDFALAGQDPSGMSVKPGDHPSFTVRFTPTVNGKRLGTLAIGGLSFPLTGTAAPIPLPKPRLTIDLPKLQSTQAGSISVSFDAPARTTGSGTVTLDFQPSASGANDATIAFASGGRSAQFTFSSGDTQGHFGTQTAVSFQTGTTAGTLTIKAQISDATDQSSVTITPAPVSVSAAAGTRQPGSIEVRITGYDNTRTAGSLAFTFFDAAGNAIAPGTIRVDATAQFGALFQNSDAGGSFALRATFPVSGDASRIMTFQVDASNSAGTTSTGRTAF